MGVAHIVLGNGLKVVGSITAGRRKAERPRFASTALVGVGPGPSILFVIETSAKHTSSSIIGRPGHRNNRPVVIIREWNRGRSGIIYVKSIRKSPHIIREIKVRAEGVVQADRDAPIIIIRSTHLVRTALPLGRIIIDEGSRPIKSGAALDSIQVGPLCVSHKPETLSCGWHQVAVVEGEEIWIKVQIVTRLNNVGVGDVRVISAAHGCPGQQDDREQNGDKSNCCQPAGTPRISSVRPMELD